MLELSGVKRVIYSAISSGRVGFTVCLRISGGIHCKIEAPRVIFQNRSGCYPIQGVADNVHEIVYRTQKKGWMTQKFVRRILRRVKSNNCSSAWRHTTSLG